MFLVCTNGDVDFAVEYIVATFEDAEKEVIGLFSAFREGSDELVKIQYEGDTLYAVRRKPVVIPDQYEYVDNDGNPINADGSDITEEVVVEEDPYEYDSILWIVRKVEKFGKHIDLTSSQHYLITSGSNIPFEHDANLTVIEV